jgi:hypothetical protein
MKGERVPDMSAGRDESGTGGRARHRPGIATEPRMMDEIGRERVTALRRQVRERAYDCPAIAERVARRMLERGEM